MVEALRLRHFNLMVEVLPHGQMSGPGTDLRANERPDKKLHMMAQTDIQTNRHCDSKTELAQGADSVKMSIVTPL